MKTLPYTFATRNSNNQTDEECDPLETWTVPDCMPDYGDEEEWED